MSEYINPYTLLLDYLDTLKDWTPEMQLEAVRAYCEALSDKGARVTFADIDYFEMAGSAA